MTTTETLRAAAAAFRHAEQETVDRREKLAVAIRACAAEGVRQVDIVAITGYKRERIRQIVAAG